MSRQRRARGWAWTADEDAYLRAHFATTSDAALAAALDRSVPSVGSRGRGLGLRKSAAYLATVGLQPGHTQGRSTQFRPGQVPPNKGLRRPGWGPGRMRETQFKPGHRDKAMPIGATRLIEGYFYRKVSDLPRVPYTVNWKPEHHLVWCAVHGPIPTGHALRFRDGNRQHVTLENLELVTREALMGRNSIQNLPAPVRQAVQLIGAINRQIRRRSHVAAQHD